MQAKLDELIYAVKKADARFIGIEHLTEEELDAILAEVEKRGLEIHAGKPARAIRSEAAPRIEEIEAEVKTEPKKSSSTASRSPSPSSRGRRRKRP